MPLIKTLARHDVDEASLLGLVARSGGVGSSPKVGGVGGDGAIVFAAQNTRRPNRITLGVKTIIAGDIQ